MENYIFGALGGFAANLVSLMEIKNPNKKILMELGFWIKFFGLPILGLIVVAAYNGSNVKLTPILSLHIGASAPLIIKSVSSVIPTKDNVN